MSIERRIYFAAPFFSSAELEYNLRTVGLLEESWRVFYPYRDGERLSELVARGETPEAAAKRVWDCDVAEIQRASILVAVLDGRVPDEGVCVEIGLARGLGKFVVGLSTDVRSCFRWGDNPMVASCLDAHCKSTAELLSVLHSRSAEGRCPTSR